MVKDKQVALLLFSKQSERCVESTYVMRYCLHPRFYIRFLGVVVITLACHARDHGFKSRRNRHKEIPGEKLPVVKSV